MAAKQTRLGIGALASLVAGSAVTLTPIEPSWWLAAPLYALTLVLGVLWVRSWWKDSDTGLPRYRLRSPIMRVLPTTAPKVGRRERREADALRVSLLILWRSTWQEAANEAERLLRLLLDEAKGTDRPSASYVGLINNAIGEKERNLFRDVSNALTVPGTDGYDDPHRMQKLVGEWWRSYQSVCAQIDDLWAGSAKDDLKVRFLNMWKRADDRFVAEIRPVIAREEFAVLRAEVIAAGLGEEARIRSGGGKP